MSLNSAMQSVHFESNAKKKRTRKIENCTNNNKQTIAVNLNGWWIEMKKEKKMNKQLKIYSRRKNKKKPTLDLQAQQPNIQF